MASKLRVEFVRIRARDSNGLQNLQDVSDRAPVTVAVSGAALTGAGRVTCPASVNGSPSYHARVTCDVECIVTRAPKGDAGTSFNASVGAIGGIHIPANHPIFIPVTDGNLLSAITGTFA